MNALAPLALVLPLAAALGLLAVGSHLPRGFKDLATVAVVTTHGVAAGLLTQRALERPFTLWMAGWSPRGGHAIGIPLVVDAASAGLMAVASLLTLVAFLLARRHFHEIDDLFAALMLLVLAGITGFLLSGDLFDQYVFLELAAVPAYAITAYRVQSPGPLVGAINYAITSSVGSTLFLLGIGLVYARAGTLALAEIGRQLDATPDPAVTAGFGLVVAALLVKSAAVPFHFAHVEAHTVAPTPALVVFAGILTELGVYGVVRIWRTAFAGVFPAGGALSELLLVAGAATALVGAALCWRQSHLKRMLAFSTISHAGLLLVAVGLGDPGALAGMVTYLTGHAAAKGALFVVVGVLLVRSGKSDEAELHGAFRGRDRWLAAGWLVAALALSDAPPFAMFHGASRIDSAARALGLDWPGVVFVVAAGLTTGALLRAGARIFLGWGPRPRLRPEGVRDRGAPREPRERPPAPMALGLVLLVAAEIVAGSWEPARDWARAAGAALADGAGYAATVLGPSPPVDAPRVDPQPETLRSYLSAGASLALAVALAVVALGRRGARASAASRSLSRPLVWLEGLHTGHIGDYLAWLVGGFAVCAYVLLGG